LYKSQVTSAASGIIPTSKSRKTLKEDIPNTLGQMTLGQLKL
jgi:hypothetical protein